jgi:hypothetical protein
MTQIVFFFCSFVRLFSHRFQLRLNFVHELAGVVHDLRDVLCCELLIAIASMLESGRKVLLCDIIKDSSYIVADGSGAERCSTREIGHDCK